MALFTRTAKLDLGVHGARCAWAMAVHHAVGITCISRQRNSGYRPSRVDIVAQGLSTPDPSLSHTHLSIRRGRATDTHYTHDQVSLVVSRNTTLVPSLGLRIGPACEASLSAGMRWKRVSPQIRKKERKKERRQSRDQILPWSNITIFKIQNGKRPPCWKIFQMPSLAYQWADWDATWVVASHHVTNNGNAITRLPMGPIRTTLGWSRPSNTSAAKTFHWYWSLLLIAQWTFWFYMGCRDQKHPQFWWNLDDCTTVVQKNKIWYKNSKY